MLITKSTIAALKPCLDRFYNFTAQYPDYSGTLEHFLALENITFKDKIWVTVRLMSHTQKVKFAIMCAAYAAAYAAAAARLKKENEILGYINNILGGT